MISSPGQDAPVTAEEISLLSIIVKFRNTE